MATTITILIFISIAISSQTICIARQPFACDPEDERTNHFPFCKPLIPIQARVEDLIGRLTLAEKVSCLVNNAAPIPRLGIQGYEWWSEALHGVSNVGPGTRFGGAFPGATSFPQVILTAAAFNKTLWETIGRVVSDEARAMYNGGQGGLTYWSPNVNIYRDPRWGRGQETPGEDPLVAGIYAASYVRGLQGDNHNKLKVAACCKHFTAYDLDNWNGVDRFHFNAKVSKQDLEDTYNVPFEMCVKEGKVASVMCSYNQVNGIPTCADPNLLGNTIRNSWNLNGYIVSDCDSVGVFFEQQHYTKTPEQAAAIAIKAGLNLDCGPFLGAHTENAVKQNLLKEAEVNVALAYLLTVQMRLGMFDGEPSDQPYGHLDPKDVCTPAHQGLALEAATQGIVLLKNSGPSLPLSFRQHRTITVIGPNSDATITMLGNYAGIPCKYTSPVEGIGRYARISHHAGCVDVACVSDNLFSEAIDYASRADATVLVMGLNQSIEAEMKDRVGLLLPGRQQELISRVAAASGGPTILVLMSGGPIDVSFAKKDPRISAILWVGYPGQAGGAAIADVLFGIANPGGKLPVTWYPQEYISNVSMTNMAMRPYRDYPGRTYRFYRGPVVYPFGHGLSYTKFVYTKTNAPSTVRISISGHHHLRNTSILGKAVKVTSVQCKKLILSLELNVKNVGSKDGSETLLVFSSPTYKAFWAPQKQLVAFEKVRVAAKNEKKVKINIDVCKSMSIVDRYGIRRLPITPHTLHIGNINHPVSFTRFF